MDIAISIWEYVNARKTHVRRQHKHQLIPVKGQTSNNIQTIQFSNLHT